MDELPNVTPTMRARRARAHTFRERHAGALPALFEAEDHYRQGGSKDVLIGEIESACRERPDLADEIRDVFRWTEHDDSVEWLGSK